MSWLYINFICMGLLKLRGAQSENYSFKSFAHSGTRTHECWIAMKDDMETNQLWLIFGEKNI